MRDLSPMRTRRFPLSESKKDQNKGQRRGRLNKDHADAMPNAAWYPTMTPYSHMRSMVVAASLPNEDNISISSPVADSPFSVAYTSADYDIISRAAKLCGFPAIKLSDKHSKESDEVHRVSPVSTTNSVF